MIPRRVSLQICFWLSLLCTGSPIPASGDREGGDSLVPGRTPGPTPGPGPRAQPIFREADGSPAAPPSNPSQGPARRDTSVQPAPGPGPAGPGPFPLGGELESILAATGNRQGRWAALVVSLDRGDTLLALRHREPMTPASNAKLFTTAAALVLLGPDFRLPTFLLGDGPLMGEVLEGNLVLYGTGDPTLDLAPPTPSRALGELAAALVEKGVKRIRGNLVVDGSFFEGPEFHPDWEPEDALEAFAPPVASVMVGESLFTLRVDPGQGRGVPPTLTTLPPITGVPFVMEARTGPPGTSPWLALSRDPDGGGLVIRGEIPAGSRPLWRRLPVSDPLLFAGLQLRERLGALGVVVEGEVLPLRNREDSPLALPCPTVQILAARESPPLLDLLREINKRSHNLYAEAVFRVLGRVVGGEGSFEGGSRVVHRFLVEQVGIAPEELLVRDGSGLSPENRTTAGALVQVLGYMAASPHWEAFWETLPEAGVRRELGRMRNTPAEGNLRAKTGTLRHVSALSGMVKTRAGERILFAILSNEVPSTLRAKRAEDLLGVRLASLARSP